MSFRWKMILAILALIGLGLAGRFVPKEWRDYIPQYWQGVFFGWLSGFIIGRISERTRAWRSPHVKPS